MEWLIGIAIASVGVSMVTFRHRMANVASALERSRGWPRSIAFVDDPLVLARLFTVTGVAWVVCGLALVLGAASLGIG